MKPIRRVVSGHDESGRSVILMLDQDFTLVGIAPDTETADLLATLILK